MVTFFHERRGLRFCEVVDLKLLLVECHGMVMLCNEKGLGFAVGFLTRQNYEESHECIKHFHKRTREKKTDRFAQMY